ncbi:acyltransferase family protein [Pseudomonas sp. GL-RE-20]|uniref:acyltransferase family protein n=1 Tax=Pseudomonas sp. GL-RE-20 TaxID=2832372 RepID=UPI001CBB0DBF|nr:acyltransferase [Pseudomonas sp. GL-RE-20]
MERNHWVDYAKAIGIILVVYGHVARGVQKAGIQMDEGLFQLVDSIIYSFHMPLFFFLSGLFFYKSFKGRGATGLVVNKVDTILYPYVVWSLLQGSLESILSKYTNGSVTFGDVLSLAWQPRAQFWFLYALFLVFVTSSLLFTLFDKSRSALLLIAFGGLYIIKGDIPSNMVLNFIIGNTFFFILGIWFEDIKSIFEKNYASLALAFGALFVIGQYAFHGPMGLTRESGGAASLALATVSIIFVVALSMCLGKIKIQWLLYVGVSSMTIYLMHVVAGSSVRVALSKFLGIQSPSAHLIIGTLIGIIAPLVAQAIIKRYHLNALLTAPKSASAEALFMRLRKNQAA